MNQKGFFQIFFLLILVVGIAVAVYLTQFTQIFKPKAAENPAQTNFFKIADSSDGHYGYGYAPSIIKTPDAKYHAFYCTAPVEDNGGFIGYQLGGSVDYIRYVSSNDSQTWSQPKVVLRSVIGVGSNGLWTNYAACDPSVVYFNGYYYLYFTTTAQTSPTSTGIAQNYIAVSRSTSIDGPYLTLAEDGQWLNNPPSSKAMVKPLVLQNQRNIGPGGLGVSWESVVVRDGKLQMWYVDDSEDIDSAAKGTSIGYMLESNDPINWDISKRKAINLVGLHSPEIKYDPVANYYLLTSIRNPHTQNAALEIAFSPDGVTWTPQTLLSSTELPDFSHNPGVLSDQRGYLLNSEDIIFGFGTSYDLRTNDTWGEWDLFGFKTKINTLPFGSFDRVSCTEEGVYGWICDKDDFSQALQVHLYFNGPAGQGKGFVAIADKGREPPVGVACGNGTSNHGFSFPIPAEFRDNQPHSIYAYGINYPTGNNSHISGSPKTFTCQPAASPSPSSVKPGDTDNDGDIDIFDFNKVITDFGKKNDPVTSADLDNDEDVDIFDFNIVVTNFGK